MSNKKMHFSVAKIKREIFVLNSLINRLDNAILSRCDISVQQAKIICLLVISTHDEIYQKDVDYFLGVTHATSHGLIKRMEEKGLISTSRGANDKRAKTLFLTQKGRSIYESFANDFFEAENKLTKGIDQDSLKQFYKTLAKMISNMKE